MSSVFKSILLWLKRNFVLTSLVCILLVSIILNVVFIDHFSKPIADTETENIASTWNNSISQIGINPLFPPQEDFYVGDVWAVVSNGASTPLIGQATRLARLPVQDLIHQASDEIAFPETEPRKADAEFRHITTC